MEKLLRFLGMFILFTMLLGLSACDSKGDQNSENVKEFDIEKTQ